LKNNTKEHAQLGNFVCLEGIDGAGKTYLAQQLTEHLKNEGISALFLSRTVLPTYPAAAERMRAIANLLWEYTPEGRIQTLGDRHLILLMASWFDLFDRWVVQPALQHHQIVITDQGAYKYIARFHVKGHWYVDSLFESLTRPDRVLLLTVEPERAAMRKESYRPTECNSRVIGDRTAFVSFQELVADQLASLRDHTWVEIDANDTADIVALSALAIIRPLIATQVGTDIAI
jgi:dTMP kinase